MNRKRMGPAPCPVHAIWHMHFSSKLYVLKEKNKTKNIVYVDFFFFTHIFFLHVDKLGKQ